MDDVEDLPLIDEEIEEDTRSFVCGPDCPGCFIQDICMFRVLLVQSAE